jgi:glutamine synthetase
MAQLFSSARGANAGAIFINFTNAYGTNIGKVYPYSQKALVESGRVSFACLKDDGLGHSPDMKDLTVNPCFSNAVLLPFDDRKTLWVPGFLQKERANHTFCPRSILDRILREAKDNEFNFQIGLEVEFYVLKSDITSAAEHEPCIPAFNIIATLELKHYWDELCDHLTKSGYEILSITHEGGRGQIEFSFKHGEPLYNVDQIVCLKTIAKELARRKGLIASFMPKPFCDEFGSSTQINISIPGFAMQAIAGIMKHAEAIMPFSCPIPNSYKRLVGHTDSINVTWAPTKISYGVDNRSSMIRYVENDDRIEFRASDFSGNLYLTVAAILAAAIDGVSNNYNPDKALTIDLFSEFDDNLPSLPLTLIDALECLESDTYIRSSLGIDFCCDYISLKKAEWAKQFYEVTEEERAQYIDI